MKNEELDFNKIINDSNCVYYIHRFNIGDVYVDLRNLNLITQQEAEERKFDNYLQSMKDFVEGFGFVDGKMPYEAFQNDYLKNGETISLEQYKEAVEKSAKEKLQTYFESGLFVMQPSIERTATSLYYPNLFDFDDGGEEDNLDDEVEKANLDAEVDEDKQSIFLQMYYNSEIFEYYKKLDEDLRRKKEKTRGEKTKGKIDSQKDELKKYLQQDGFGFRTRKQNELLGAFSNRDDLNALLILEIPNQCIEEMPNISPLFQKSSNFLEIFTTYYGEQKLDMVIPRQYIKAAICKGVDDLLVIENPNYQPNYILQEGLYNKETVDRIFHLLKEHPEEIDINMLNKLLDIVYSQYCFGKMELDTMKGIIEQIAHFSQYVDDDGSLTEKMQNYYKGEKFSISEIVKDTAKISNNKMKEAATRVYSDIKLETLNLDQREGDSING